MSLSVNLFFQKSGFAVRSVVSSNSGFMSHQQHKQMSDSKNESLWTIILEFLKKEGIANQHIDSYNRFIEKGIQEIIKEFESIDITIETQKYTQLIPILSSTS